LKKSDIYRIYINDVYHANPAHNVTTLLEPADININVL